MMRLISGKTYRMGARVNAEYFNSSEIQDVTNLQLNKRLFSNYTF